jgi:hypothetical protein
LLIILLFKKNKIFIKQANQKSFLMKTLAGKEFPAPKAVTSQRMAKMNYIIRTDGLMMMMSES